MNGAGGLGLIMSLWPERLNDEAAENPRSKSEYYGRDSPITFMSTTQPPFELPPAHHRIVFDDIRGDIIIPFNYGC
jgi:hypothetical protein